MVKKKFLCLLLIILSISSPCIRAGHLIPSNIQMGIDIVNYVSEMGNITALESQNSLLIKSISVVSSIKNTLLGLHGGKLCIEQAQCIYKLENPSESQFSEIQLFSSFTLYATLENIKFGFWDKKIAINSDRIANYNIKENRVENQKKKQALWLTFNKLFPYIILAIKRLKWDRCAINNALYYTTKESKSSKSLSVKVFTAARLLSTLLENWRRYLLYKKINQKITAQQKTI